MNVTTRGTSNVLTKGTTDLITVNQIGNGLAFAEDTRFVNLNAVQTQLFPNDFTTRSYSLFVTSNNVANFREQVYLSRYKNFDGINGWKYISSYRVDNTILFFIRFVTRAAAGTAQRASIYVPFVANKIYHIVCVTDTFNANNWKVYVDGVDYNVIPAENTLLVTDNFSNTDVCRISYYSNGSPFATFSGNIYDLKVFDRVVTPSEVTQLYTSFGNDLAGLTSNIVANYDFNQKIGTQLTDKSPNQNHGTLTNFSDTSLGGSNSWVNSLGTSITL